MKKEPLTSKLVWTEKLEIGLGQSVRIGSTKSARFAKSDGRRTKPLNSVLAEVTKLSDLMKINQSSKMLCSLKKIYFDFGEIENCQTLAQMRFYITHTGSCILLGLKRKKHRYEISKKSNMSNNLLRNIGFVEPENLLFAKFVGRIRCGYFEVKSIQNDEPGLRPGKDSRPSASFRDSRDSYPCAFRPYR